MLTNKSEQFFHGEFALEPRGFKPRQQTEVVDVDWRSVFRWTGLCLGSAVAGDKRGIRAKELPALRESGVQVVGNTAELAFALGGKGEKLLKLLCFISVEDFLEGLDDVRTTVHAVHRPDGDGVKSVDVVRPLRLQQCILKFAME